MSRPWLLAFAVCISLLSAAVHAQTPAPTGPTGPVACPATCTGTGSVSCAYCPGVCGLCPNVGVIDHCTQAGTVHLSFDDGPNDNTGPVLDILKEKGVKASFWVIGAQVPPRQAVTKRIVDEGHFIGLHSYTHAHLNDATGDTVYNEIVPAYQAIQVAAQVNPTHYRPPFGELNEQLRLMITLGVNQTGHIGGANGSPGLTPVLWNVDSQDWQANEQLLRSTVDGAMTTVDPAVSSWIILLHANNPVAMANVPWVIDRVRARGYTIIGAPQCFDKTANVNQYVTPITKDKKECNHPPLTCVWGAPCGPNATCCGANTCCGAFGFCGTGPAFCAANLCQNGDCETCTKMPIPDTFVPTPPPSPPADSAAPRASTPAGGIAFAALTAALLGATAMGSAALLTRF